jgi:hypothetical protein
MKNKSFTAVVFVAALTTAASASIFARQEGQHPSHQHGQAAHVDSVNKRGDHVMGFDHTKTTHHFLLYADGGSIEVAANDAADKESRDQVRKNLGHIAKMFASGNFNAPMLVHDRMPPGVPTMQRLRSEIKYDFEETGRGARVRPRTANPEALSALHEFLRFQIEEHETGDSTEVKPLR